MFGVKKLAGLGWFANGASARPFLRFMLIPFSLLGVVSSSLLTGNQIDPDCVSALVRMLFETGVPVDYVGIRRVFGADKFY
jgi:hypothetical protein